MKLCVKVPLTFAKPRALEELILEVMKRKRRSDSGGPQQPPGPARIPLAPRRPVQFPPPLRPPLPFPPSPPARPPPQARPNFPTEDEPHSLNAIESSPDIGFATPPRGFLRPRPPPLPSRPQLQFGGFFPIPIPTSQPLSGNYSLDLALSSSDLVARTIRKADLMHFLEEELEKDPENEYANRTLPLTKCRSHDVEGYCPLDRSYPSSFLGLPDIISKEFQHASAAADLSSMPKLPDDELEDEILEVRSPAGARRKQNRRSVSRPHPVPNPNNYQTIAAGENFKRSFGEYRTKVTYYPGRQFLNRSPVPVRRSGVQRLYQVRTTPKIYEAPRNFLSYPSDVDSETRSIIRKAGTPSGANASDSDAVVIPERNKGFPNNSGRQGRIKGKLRPFRTGDSEEEEPEKEKEKEKENSDPKTDRQKVILTSTCPGCQEAEADAVTQGGKKIGKCKCFCEQFQSPYQNPRFPYQPPQSPYQPPQSPYQPPQSPYQPPPPAPQPPPPVYFPPPPPPQVPQAPPPWLQTPVKIVQPQTSPSPQFSPSPTVDHMEFLQKRCSDIVDRMLTETPLESSSSSSSHKSSLCSSQSRIITPGYVRDSLDDALKELSLKIFGSTVASGLPLPQRPMTLTKRQWFGWACKNIDVTTLMQDVEYFVGRLIQTNAIGYKEQLITLVTNYLLALIQYYKERNISIDGLEEPGSDEFDAVITFFDHSQSLTIERLLQVSGRLFATAVISKRRRMGPNFSKRVKTVNLCLNEPCSEEEIQRLSKLDQTALDVGILELIAIIDVLAFHCRLPPRENPILARIFERLSVLNKLKQEEPPDNEKENEFLPTPVEVLRDSLCPPNDTEDQYFPGSVDFGFPTGPYPSSPAQPDSYYVKLAPSEKIIFQVCVVCRIDITVVLANPLTSKKIPLPGWDVIPLSPDTIPSAVATTIVVQLNAKGEVSVNVTFHQGDLNRTDIHEKEQESAATSDKDNGSDDKGETNEETNTA
ncbi:unnamed protein product [Cyprideis torosa]|uniref:Uncharacterized protein n=1 Tax=Cyprideis torosa TaxID=163714 RepID=A0A7R8WAB7_9CRUS|nr:unnamed protein product [Cyprideis torosa]CAG0886186.1 unnamed protein product [Cyprideis torosa]